MQFKRNITISAVIAFLFPLFQLIALLPTSITANYIEILNSMEAMNSLLYNLSTRHPNLTNIPYLTIDERLLEDEAQIPTTELLNITNTNFKQLNAIIENRQIWRSLKHPTRPKVASAILQLINQLGALLNAIDDDYNSTIEGQTTRTFTSLVIQSKLFPIDGPGEVMQFNLEHTRVELPFSALYNSTLVVNDSSNISATVVLTRNLTTRLSSASLHVNSKIISFIIEDESQIGQLNTPFRYHLWHLHRLEFFDQRYCAWWSFNRTAWLSEGCSVRIESSSRYATVCECTRLESNVFAVIVDVSQQEGSILAKSILTYIGSALSCLFLGLAVYILVEYQDVCKGLQGKRDKHYQLNLTKETNKISLAINISIYLLLSHVWVMLGYNLSNAILCNLNTIFQLFSLLATLSFMALLSAHYVLVKYEAFDSLINFKYFNWIGHTIPAAIIIGSLMYISLGEQTEILTGNSLAGEYFCWISSPNYPENIYIFIYPASALIFLTLFCCISILFGRCCPLIRSEKAQVKFDLQLLNVVVLIFNFALPWIAYTLYINEFFGHFSYLFIFFNAVQGLFFFTFQYTFYRLHNDDAETDKKKVIC